jgi:hypothetical protein
LVPLECFELVHSVQPTPRCEALHIPARLGMLMALTRSIRSIDVKCFPSDTYAIGLSSFEYYCLSVNLALGPVW